MLYHKVTIKMEPGMYTSSEVYKFFSSLIRNLSVTTKTKLLPLLKKSSGLFSDNCSTN